MWSIFTFISKKYLLLLNYFLFLHKIEKRQYSLFEQKHFVSFVHFLSFCSLTVSLLNMSLVKIVRHFLRHEQGP